MLNARRNAKIEARNEVRLAALAALRAPDTRLRRKLANAARQAERVVISDKDIVYSSDKCGSLEDWDFSLGLAYTFPCKPRYTHTDEHLLRFLGLKKGRVLVHVKTHVKKSSRVGSTRFHLLRVLAAGTCRELAAQPADTEVKDFERRLHDREARLHQREAERSGRHVSIFDLQRESDLETRP